MRNLRNIQARLRRARAFASGAVLIPIVLLGLACGAQNSDTAVALTGGDPERGRLLMRHYGCHTCHTIPGVRSANAVVGPPLNRIATRTFIGGGSRNDPETLIRFIRNPLAVNPGSAMPAVGVTERDARDLAAYLYTLR